VMLHAMDRQGTITDDKPKLLHLWMNSEK
jgi:hypothetical protein